MKSVSSQSDVANQRDHFALFAIMFALSLSFKIIESTKFIDGAINLTFHTFAILVAAAMVIAKPRSTNAFLLMCLLYAFYAAAKHPFGSNSMMMQATITLIALTAAAVVMVRGRTWVVGSAELFAMLAPVGRFLLLIMYFFGVFHKLNTDWFNPEISCASILWELPFIPFPFGIQEALWAKHSAIHGTLLLETICLLALMIGGRYSYYGVILGVLFHGYIGTSNFRYYWAFSSLSIALHFLFLPSNALERFRQTTFYEKIRHYTKPNVMFPIIFLLALSLAYGRAFLLLFYNYSIWCVFWIAVSWFVWRFGNRPELSFKCISSPALWAKPFWLNVITLLFFINASAPYIGLANTRALSMFSNLRTEGGVSNHLVFQTPPYLFDFIGRSVRILDSSSRYLRGIGDDKRLPYVAFKAFMQKNPKTRVTYELDGQVYHINGIAEAPELASKKGIWATKHFTYPPYDEALPRYCESYAKRPVVNLMDVFEDEQ